MKNLSLTRTALVVAFCVGMVVASPAQTVTILASFSGTNGSAPLDAPMVQGIDGSYYGTASQGGEYGYGSVYKMTPAGVLTALHSFDVADGSAPWSGLVQSASGTFYGTTSTGGVYGLGTVFEITPSGKLTTLLSFNGSNGEYPYSGLVQANGNFYGVTFYGGTYGQGTVYKITPSGTLTTLHSFGFDLTDGANPWAALAQATNGNLYGTTSLGGSYNYGTFFEITLSGTLTTLYSFCPQIGDCADGEWPTSTPVQGADGNFYGTAPSGGDLTCNACLYLMWQSSSRG